MALPLDMMSNNGNGTELNLALEGCIDRSFFLEYLVVRAAQVLSLEDLLMLLDDVKRFIGAEGAAAYIWGSWLSLQHVPLWLRLRKHPHRTDIYPLSDTLTASASTQAIIAAPFSHGWLALWGEHFSFEDLRLANVLSDISGTVLTSLDFREARGRVAQLEHDHHATAQIWRDLMPSTLVPLEGYTRRLLFRPQQLLAGDFVLSETQWLVLGDVSGKGQSAALVASMMLPVTRLCMQRALKTPDVFLPELARAVAPELERTELLITLSAVCLHPTGKVMHYNAGHMSTLLRRRDGTVESYAAHTPPLGSFPITQHTPEVMHLEPGEMLLLFSDGLTDAWQQAHTPNGLWFGLPRLQTLLAGATDPDGFIQELQQSLEAWSLHDDLTVVIICYNGL